MDVTAPFEEGKDSSTLNATNDAPSIKESDPLLRNDLLPDAEESIKLPAGLKYESELGRGGMGVVYLAKDEVLNRQVAVKVILHSQFASPKDIQRFRAEASILARLQHPNIVHVYAGGEFLKCPYLVLEYVSDGTLAARLKKEKVSLPIALDLIEKIARGVQAAHDEGIIHRDLKPQNILLGKARNDQSWSTAWGTPKVADFGLAKLFVGEDTQQTGSQAVMGTPAYMSPEQAAGMTRDVTVAADIYALGGILYTLLTNKAPFEGTSAVDILGKVQKSMPIKPSRVNASVPVELDTICMRCLAKDPQKRYNSALELAEVLHEYRERHQLIPRSNKKITPGPGSPRRNVLVKPILLAASVVVISLLAWSLFNLRPAEIVQTHSTKADATEVSPPLEKQYPALPEEIIKELEKLDGRINQNSFRIPLDNGHELRLYTTGTGTTKLEKIQYIAKPDQQLEITPKLSTKLEILTTVIDRVERKQLLISKELENVQLAHSSVGKTASDASTATLTLSLPPSTLEKATLVGGVRGSFQLIEASPILPIQLNGQDLRQFNKGDYHIDFAPGKLPQFYVQPLQIIFTPDFLRRTWMAPVQDGRGLPDVVIEDRYTVVLGYKDVRFTNVHFDHTMSRLYFKPPMTATFDITTKIDVVLNKQKQKQVTVDDESVNKSRGKAFGGAVTLPLKSIKKEWVQDVPAPMTFDLTLKVNSVFEVTFPNGNNPKYFTVRSTVDKLEIKPVNNDPVQQLLAKVVSIFAMSELQKLKEIKLDLSTLETQPLFAKLWEANVSFSQVGPNNIVELKFLLHLGE